MRFSTPVFFPPPRRSSFRSFEGVAGVSRLHSPPPPKGPVAQHPGAPCRVSQVFWTSPQKPCRAPRGVAAIRVGVALHFDTKLGQPPAKQDQMAKMFEQISDIFLEKFRNSKTNSLTAVIVP